MRLLSPTTRQMIGETYSDMRWWERAFFAAVILIGVTVLVAAVVTLLIAATWIGQW